MNPTIKTSYINGKFLSYNGEELLDNTNPSKPSEVIEQFARANIVQTEHAINTAEQASTVWRNSNPQVRADSLDRIGTEILQRKQELAELLSTEEGKTVPEAIGEVSRAGNSFKFYAQEILRAHGEIYLSVRNSVDINVYTQAVGVVGIITPWNFPIAIPAWKIAPALAFGNTVVFKPAELVPSSAWALSEIISRSGLPAGVFNMVIGPGRTVGDTIIRSPKIDAISFTGSKKTGQSIAQIAVARFARVQLEMSGKNPLIILDDADLDVAVDVTVNGSFYSTGQRCTASSRIIVTAGIYENFIKKLKERTDALIVGNALDPDTQIGPVASKAELDINLDYVRIAQEEGAFLLCGGNAINNDNNAYFMQPTVFTDIKPSMRVYREEIFGPIIAVLKVADYEEAVAAAEDTEFGLSAGIVTTSLKYAEDFKRRSSAGMVMVNLPTAGVDYHVAFGGNRASSYGSREQGTIARQFYTKVKTTYQTA